MERDTPWRQAIRELPQFVPDFRIRPRDSALLVVDMQNCCVRPDYGFGKILRDHYPELAEYYFPRIKQVVIPNISRLIAFFREQGLRVIFLTVGPELVDGSDMFLRRRRRDEKRPRGDVSLRPWGTFEHEIVPELIPVAGELVINKNSMGAFNSTAIEQLLKNMQITGLVVTGVSTDACVDTTARDAADRGYEVYLVEDACASSHPQRHESTLVTFSMLCGRVTTTDEVIQELRGGFGGLESSPSTDDGSAPLIA